MPFLSTLRSRAAALKRDILALWFCRNHPRTPWYAKALVAAVVAYAFSPIDLIPDFIPVLGYVDDLIIVPAGIYLALRLIPEDVLAEGRQKADVWIAERRDKPKNYVAAAVIVAIWLAAAWTLSLLFAF